MYIMLISIWQSNVFYINVYIYSISMLCEQKTVMYNTEKFVFLHLFVLIIAIYFNLIFLWENQQYLKRFLSTSIINGYNSFAIKTWHYVQIVFFFFFRFLSKSSHKRERGRNCKSDTRKYHIIIIIFVSQQDILPFFQVILQYYILINKNVKHKFY